jgi:drug/metabolite transporter (DMT)-like permease
VLVLVAGIAGLGGGVSALECAGVAVVALGVLTVRRSDEATDTKAITLALATAATIAAYTLVDHEGLQHADPLPYLWLVIAPAALLTITVTTRRDRQAVLAALGPRTVAAGLATFGAYALVLAALQRAPAAPVAATRETSIVLAVAAGAVLLGEPVGRQRALGALAVTAGVALVALA